MIITTRCLKNLHATLVGAVWILLGFSGVAYAQAAPAAGAASAAESAKARTDAAAQSAQGATNKDTNKAANAVPPTQARSRIVAATKAATAEEAVEQAAQSVLDLIETSRPWVNEDPERFYREVEVLIAPVIDFDRFARNVMATFYKDATPAQRKRFAETFKWGLVRTYALALTKFKNGSIKVVPPERAPRDPKSRDVKMEISQGGEMYTMIYRMRLYSDGSWRLYNVVIEGINMVLNYRSQFAAAARDSRYGGDMDKVIDAWAGAIENSNA